MTMVSAPGHASSAETGSGYTVKDAWDAFTYVYNPPLHLVVVSLDPICNVGSETGRTTVEMAAPGEAARTRRRCWKSQDRRGRCREGACRAGPAMESAMIDEIAAVGLQTR